MRWQKISLNILAAMLLAWAAFSATAADVDTDKSLIVTSTKIEAERDLTAAKLRALPRTQRDLRSGACCRGFSRGRRMPTQRLVRPSGS